MRIDAAGTAIEVDDRGSPAGDPLLMLMGLGMPLTAWPEELVLNLVARGFRVIRIDNRDAGLSQSFDELGVPNLVWAGLRHALHWPVHAPYKLADMAADALGVLDALGLQRAHVCGASMGGMIAQHLAARCAERVKSLTLMMSSSGARQLPMPSPRVARVLMSRPNVRNPASVVAYLTRLLGVIGSPGYPSDAQMLQLRLQALVARGWNSAGTARQLAAVAADGDRTPLLARIQSPTLVIHGRDDALLPLACGHDLVAKIPGAVADYVPGLGHDLPLALLPRFAAAIAENAARASD